jgi:hypothetical protein
MSQDYQSQFPAVEPAAIQFGVNKNKEEDDGVSLRLTTARAKRRGDLAQARMSRASRSSGNGTV